MPTISALWEDCKFKPSVDNLVIQQDHVSKNIKGWEVAQCEGPEFCPQYCKKHKPESGWTSYASFL